MNKVKIFLISLLFIVYIDTVNCVYYNVSFGDLDKCREYDATSGYGYQTYFKIEDVNNHRANGSIINLKLYIMGPKDAHILLSTNEAPSTLDPVYEIVLGGGGNTFSEIRRKRKTQALQSFRRKNLLSPLNPIPISINIFTNGTIQVGVVGEASPLLSVIDKNPLQIKYISFCSWGTTETKFFYDCRTKDSEYYDELNETKVRNLSLGTKLAFHLYSFANEDINNINARNISVQFKLHQIAFHTKDGTLTTRGKFNLRWKHPTMIWDPMDYGGLEHTFIRNLASWSSLNVPPILLINSKDSSFSQGLSMDFIIRAQYTGELFAESTEVSMNTICSDYGSDHNWPVDEVTCDIQLGVINDNLTLVPEENDFFTIQYENYYQSEWHMKNVHLLHNFSSIVSFGIREFNPVEIAYSLRLKRSTLYYKIFCGPLFGACIFILLSFWAKHFLRASLNLIGMLILTTMFAFTMDYSPKSYVPLLLRYYQISLYLSWLAFFLFIVTCWVEKMTPNIQSSHWLAKCMQFTWLRLLIGLNIPNNYNQLNREEVSWISVNLFVNRIIFLVYFTLFLVGIMHGI